MRIDYQALRHGRPARLVRGALFRALVGRDGWPPVFRAANGDVRGTSRHLYVHLPFCRRICPHCPYNKVRFDPDLHRTYEDALLAEVESYLRQPDVPPIRSLYFGGGTPTTTPGAIEAVLARVAPRLAVGAEVAVEVHPADACTAMLARLRAAGVNRISLGVESFDAACLRRLGRGYEPEGARCALVEASRAGFAMVDANLIFGIPGQSAHGPAADARRCIALGADQVSAYPLITFLHTSMGRNGGDIVDDRVRLAAQRAVARACLDAGFVRTSVWSYTRPGLTPYSTVTREDYVGFGAGAGSLVEGVFSFNTFDVEAYGRCRPARPALVLRASPRFRRFHWLYWQVYRTSIAPGRYRQLFGRDLARDFALPLAVLRVLGLARNGGGRVRLTERGAIWVHRLQCLYSLSFVDQLWSRCHDEAWPEEVVLR